MANFKQTVITKAAHNLIAKSLSGSANINFTRVATSKYDYKSFSQSKLESLTSLEDIKQYVAVDKVEKIGESSVNVSVKITNANITEGYYVNTIGLFAIDPEKGEILYSVTVAETADYFPADNGVNCSGINLDLVTEVSNASNVNITVNYAGYATNEDIEKVNSQLNEKANQLDLNTTNNNVALKANQVDLASESASRQNSDAVMQSQINSLVLGAVGSGNNAEVVQAHGNFDVIDSRFRKIESLNNLIGTDILNISWEIGGISPTTHEEVDSTSNARTEGYIYMLGGTTISSNDPSNYEIGIHMYDDNLTWFGRSGSDTTARVTTFTIPIDCYCRIGVTDTHAGTMTTVIPNAKLNIEYYKDINNIIKSNVTKLKSEEKTGITWELGGINWSDGLENNYLYVCRSNYFKVTRGTVITADSTCEISVKLYDGINGNAIGKSGSDASLSLVQSFTVPVDCYCRLVLRMNDYVASNYYFAPIYKANDLVTITYANDNAEYADVNYSIKNISVASDNIMYDAIISNVPVRSIVFQVKKGYKYVISTLGAHNKFIVALTSQFQVGKTTTIQYSKTSTMGNEYYEYTNNTDYNYCIVYYDDTGITNLTISIKERKITEMFNHYWKTPFIKGINSTRQNALNIDGSINYTSDQIIANIYEPLRVAYPNYITRQNIGKDASGTYDMWCYIFAPKYYDKTVYLQGGVHTVETEGYWGLARLMQLICNNHEDNPRLEYLYQTVRFIVVPIVNVWGVTTKPSYTEQGISNKNSNEWYASTNSNGVNLNRDNLSTTKQQETINIQSLFDKYSATIDYAFDCHTTTMASWGDYLMDYADGSPNANVLLRTNDYLLNQNIKDRATNNVFAGPTSQYPPNGITGTFTDYFFGKGVPAAVIEHSDYVFDYTLGTDIALTRAAENYGNQVIQNLIAK